MRNDQRSDIGKYTCKVFRSYLHDEYLQTGIVHLQVKVEDDGILESRTMAGETSRRENIIYITDRICSISAPNLDRHTIDQNTRRTREGNTASPQEFNPLTPNQQSEITSEFVILPTMAIGHMHKRTLEQEYGSGKETRVNPQSKRDPPQIYSHRYKKEKHHIQSHHYQEIQHKHQRDLETECPRRRQSTNTN